MRTIINIIGFWIIVALCSAFGFGIGWTYRDLHPVTLLSAIDENGKLTKVTAYCPCIRCCDKYADGITASGHRIRKGDRFVAANPNIPFGTLFIVPGYNDDKPVPVLDRGGAIKGDCIDVFFDTHKEALNWGVKWLKVTPAKPE